MLCSHIHHRKKVRSVELQACNHRRSCSKGAFGNWTLVRAVRSMGSQTRVRRTGANRPVYYGVRCYRWPPGPVCTGAYRSGFKYSEFEFKKLKNETKIPKNTSRFIESNSVNFFANLVHLVFFFDHYNISQNRKRKKSHYP
jgi:hypothetical protein